MDKLSFFLILFIFIFPLYISDENVNNSTENITETLNATNETNDQNFFFKRPFDDFDFANVIWLDDTNSTSEIKKHELLYIVFYSPWCQYCHIYLPIYVNASRYAEEKNLKVKFAKVDTSVSLNTSDEFKLEGVPSVYLIYKGEKIFFAGERTEEGLFKFLDRKLNDDVYKFEKLEQVKKFVADSSSLVLLSTLRYENTELYRAFLNYSKVAQSVDFISCVTDECVKEYKQDLILFKKFDEKVNKYTEEYGSISNAKNDSVKELIGTYGVECGGDLNETQLNLMFEHKKKMVFYFRNASMEEHTKYDKVIKDLGKALRKKNIYTSLVDIQGSLLHHNVAQTFVIVNRDLPVVLFYDLNPEADPRELAFIYTIRNGKKEQLNKEYLLDYLNKIEKGEIKKDLYSEPPLDNYTINGLKYVIGRTYDKDVLEEKKNVFLTLIDGGYISNDTERVLSIMRNLTKKYENKEDKNVVFAYFDASRNQPRNIDLSQEMPPLVFLFTNALKEKKMIKFNPENFTTITEGEVEDFLYEKLNWGKRPQDENKEKGKKTEEKKVTDL